MHQRDVELSAAHGSGDGGRVELGHHELQAGVVAAERDQRGREDRAHRGGERADPQRPGQAAPGGGEARGGLLQQGQHRLGLLGQRGPGRGERDPAADAPEQRDPGLTFQRGQLLRDRGRRVAERVGDRGDRPAVSEFPQQSELANVKHQFSLRISEEI